LKPQYAADGICLAISQQAAAPMTSLATAVLGSIQLTPTTISETTVATPGSTSAPQSTILNSSSHSSDPIHDSATTPSITSSQVSTTSASASSSSSSASSSSTQTVLSPAPVPTASSLPNPYTASYLSTPAITGIIVGTMSVLISVAVSGFVFRSKFRMRPGPILSPESYN
jgi:hypothetical protein